MWKERSGPVLQPLLAGVLFDTESPSLPQELGVRLGFAAWSRQHRHSNGAISATKYRLLILPHWVIDAAGKLFLQKFNGSQ